MQSINNNIIGYQESGSVPSISWKVQLIKNGTTYDVSTRFKGGNPGIIDSADYRENLTYVNEIVLTLNNDDKFLSNVDKTGILDVAEGTLIEVKISGYFNILNGNNYPLLKFGGWVDLDKTKPNETKKQVNVSCYSYLGLADYVSAANITTQYIDAVGLILWNTGLWVRNAAIANYILQNGIHKIETRTSEGVKQARLDDGDWVSFNQYDHEYILKNHFDTERVLIYYDWGDNFFQEDNLSYIVVKNQGQQYPETFYYYPEIRIIIQKAFEYLNINQTEIQRYDIQTYDGRKVPSLLKYVISSMTNSAISIVSDDNYRMFISVVTADSIPINQIWYYNYYLDTLTKIYETTENTYTQHRLVLDTVLNILIAWYDNKPEDEEHGLIQVFDLSTPLISYTTVLIDATLENANAYIRFHYLYDGHQILIMKEDGIYTLGGIYGWVVTKIIDEANIETYGFSCMWQKPGTYYYLYFTKNVGGVRKIYRAQWAGYWMAAEYVKDFFNQSDFVNYYTFPFYSENKIITLHNNTGVRYFKVTDNSEGSIDIGAYQVNSFYEHDSKMFYFAQLEDETDKRIGSITNNIAALETDNLNTNRFFAISANWLSATQVQKISTIKNINNQYDLIFISNRPAFLLRFSKWVTPYIYGEFDYSIKTIRQLLQDIANNYLGFVKISALKKGYFVLRDSYSSNDTLIIKADYIKTRATERVYNEIYDAVVVKTQNVEAYRGDRAVDAKILNVSLELVSDELAYDLAQYFLDYYSVLRKLITINYLPTFYNYDSLDKVDLTDLSLPNGKIHKINPKKESSEISVLYEEENK